MKILLAIDGSTYAEAAVSEITARPWPAGTEVMVVCAVEPPLVTAAEPWVMPPAYSGELEKAAQERARATVETAAKQLSDGATPLKVTTAMPIGWPKQVILEQAEAWGADLIVLGSHGYGAWERFLLGSVSNTVATHAKCSVEIVRRRGALSS